MARVIIINTMPFPEGYAATNRFVSYARGLIGNGTGVTVLTIRPTEFPGRILNHSVSGKYQDIEFEYSAGTTTKSKIIFFRPFINLYGILNSFRTIVKANRKEKISALIFIGPIGFWKELGYYLLSRILNIKIIQERSEYPFLTQKSNIIFHLRLWFYLQINCKLYDAMLVISDVLYHYFRRYTKNSAQFHIMPIVVDPERFNIKQDLPDKEYIAYCGSMENNKDGLMDLLDAFFLLKRNFPRLLLKLIGRTEFSGFEKLKEKVNSSKFGPDVIFTGRVSNDEMVRLLNKAKILVLARPESIQAEANFPTKLGEYLATGKPVLATRVGGIPNYLEDGRNAFLVMPSNPKLFAERLEEIMNNYEWAVQVGKEGQKLAYTEFNYLVQGKRFAEFIHGL